MKPDASLPPAAALHFELEVQPETAGCPWRALLKPRNGEPAIEFDTPLALARYVAQFVQSYARGGLR